MASACPGCLRLRLRLSRSLAPLGRRIRAARGLKLESRGFETSSRSSSSARRTPAWVALGTARPAIAWLCHRLGDPKSFGNDTTLQ
eukprot:CAMPEP_0185615766 /NCGR_PEP_ID=MMETSP0436-20130131/37157_1 /TAXON_ID=626734 ORGANISM="Favella taraikaensis, Strain Fe Narragansett Bay" /NCGR_SAMPLE_ID=MMETSP0436 /ASSEMBLY_ACC=CAM_ASM_000390 /LENGTH=85 /DNA_ID=CAMNT_0028251863 /DNA_START=135 /DNA_END=389 /DNA_ORIENTATION=+